MWVSEDDTPEVVMSHLSGKEVPHRLDIPVDSGPPSVLLKEGLTFLLPAEARSLPSNKANKYPETPVYYPLCRDRRHGVEDGGVWFYFKNPGGSRTCRMFAPEGLVPGVSHVTVVWVDTLYACVRRATDEEVGKKMLASSV